MQTTMDFEPHPSQRRYLEIQVLKAHNLDKLGFSAFDDRYFVVVNVDDESQRTHDKSTQSPVWEQTLAFTPGNDTPTLTLEVHARDTWKHKILGSISHIINLVGESHIYKESIHGDGQQTTHVCGVLEYTVSTKFGNAHDLAANAIASLSTPGVGMVIAEELNALSISSLVQQLEKFSEIMSVFSEIHPYAKAAWQIISLAYQLYHKQMEKDTKMRALYKGMDVMYKVLFDGGRLQPGALPKASEHQWKILLRVSQQTNECAYFIRDYCSRSRREEVKAWFTDRDTDAKIEAYTKSFHNLEKEFREEIDVVTQISVGHLLSGVEDIGIQLDLNMLLCIPGSSLGSHDKRCLSNTRTGILDEIYAWINMSSVGDGESAASQPILLLTGDEGIGKSALAHTIADHFKNIHRLGASFTFNVDVDTKHCADGLFPHISRHLTELSPSIKKAIASEVHDHPSLCSSTDLEEQFQKLIQRPLQKWKGVGPVVIVIDGLNGGSDGVAPRCEVSPCEKIASILVENAEKLPSDIRIVITSRPEPAILHIFTSTKRKEIVLHKDLTAISQDTLYSDMCVFVQDRMRYHIDRRGQLLAGVDEQCCRILAAASMGNYGWAAETVQRICDSAGQAMVGGTEPKKEFEDSVVSVLKGYWPKAGGHT
ncbi:hypothetical protein NM688_g2293 [Phlebia brevispora]|uniref:Uncharacterized protein n=1 Tax=Phlebia brevispora TaxID=194682 RepID=A0ACC1T8X3_9APHY|nr:hypothetical protein NM688_g2293 [Phlebia brevispora]